MLKIGDFSKLSRVSVRMLRHYDELGLLVPASTDPFTGYRYYSAEQLAAAARIASLRAMGFALAEIRALLTQPSPEFIAQAFTARREEEAAALEQASQRLRLLDTALQRLRKDGTVMKYDITIKSLPQRQVASVRMTLPAYEMEGTLWGTMMQEVAPLHLVEDDPCLCTVLFHDGEWKESMVDLEAQKTVKGSYPDTEHVRFKTMPAVTFASAIHRGSYQTLDEVYPAVGAWVLDNGYEMDGPVFNIYHVSPHETSCPDEFVTEVCYPIRKG